MPGAALCFAQGPWTTSKRLSKTPFQVPMMQNHHAMVKQRLASGHTTVTALWLSTGVADLPACDRRSAADCDREPFEGGSSAISLRPSAAPWSYPGPLASHRRTYAVDHTMISRLP